MITVPDDTVKQFNEVTKLLVEARFALEQAVEDISWMSGASDFAEGYSAHEGWLDIQKRLEKAREFLRKIG